MARDMWSRYPPWRGLYEALRQGDTGHVLACLNHNMDFRLPIVRKLNALDFAAFHGNVGVVKSILNHRQFKMLALDEKWKLILSMFTAACHKNNISAVKRLLEELAKRELRFGQLSTKAHAFLMKEIRNLLFVDMCLEPEHDDILDYLMVEETDPLTREMIEQELRICFQPPRFIQRQRIVWLMRMYKLGVREMCEILGIKNVVLLEACIGKVETVSELMDIWFAGKHGQRWECGGPTFELPHFKDEAGNSVIHIAALAGRADMVRMLLNKVSWIVKDRGWTLEEDADWRDMLDQLVDLPIDQVKVLNCLPREAFNIHDAAIPDGSSFEGLPWFFSRGSRAPEDPDCRCVRELLHDALQHANPNVFQFYVDNYKIHEDQIRISTKKDWYLLENEERDEERLLSDYSPIFCLSKFPVQLIIKYISRDKDSLVEMLEYGDVRVIQALNQHFSALEDKDFAGWAGMYGCMCSLPQARETGYDDPEFLLLLESRGEEYLFPLPATEYITDYYKQPKPGPGETASWRFRAQMSSELFVADLRCSEFHLAKLHARETMKIILTKFPMMVDIPELSFSIKDTECKDIFKAKRYVKGLKYRQLKEEHEKQTSRYVEFGKLIIEAEGQELSYWRDKKSFETKWHNCFGNGNWHPYLNSVAREQLILQGGLLPEDSSYNYNYLCAKLIAAMELHDFSQDFGPVITDLPVHIEGNGDRRERRLFFRDFLLSLSGSHEFFLYWDDVLNFLTCRTSLDEVKVTLTKHHQVYELLANVGVVIVDRTFYTGTRPGPMPRNLYQKAMTREHPDITKQRRALPLVSHCRIAIHKYLRKIPGFQSDKIRAMDLPPNIERFMLFDDIRENWDNVKYRMSVF